MSSVLPSWMLLLLSCPHGQAELECDCHKARGWGDAPRGPHRVSHEPYTVHACTAHHLLTSRGCSAHHTKDAHTIRAHTPRAPLYGTPLTHLTSRGCPTIRTREARPAHSAHRAHSPHTDAPHRIEPHRTAPHHRYFLREFVAEFAGNFEEVLELADEFAGYAPEGVLMSTVDVNVIPHLAFSVACHFCCLVMRSCPDECTEDILTASRLSASLTRCVCCFVCVSSAHRRQG